MMSGLEGSLEMTTTGMPHAQVHSPGFAVAPMQMMPAQAYASPRGMVVMAAPQQMMHPMQMSSGQGVMMAAQPMAQQMHHGGMAGMRHTRCAKPLIPDAEQSSRPFPLSEFFLLLFCFSFFFGEEGVCPAPASGKGCAALVAQVVGAFGGSRAVESVPVAYAPSQCVACRDGRFFVATDTVTFTYY